MKSGEKVLPSYAGCRGNTIYPDVPLRMLCVAFDPWLYEYTELRVSSDEADGGRVQRGSLSRNEDWA